MRSLFVFLHSSISREMKKFDTCLPRPFNYTTLLWTAIHHLLSQVFSVTSNPVLPHNTSPAACNWKLHSIDRTSSAGKESRLEVDEGVAERDHDLFGNCNWCLIVGSLHQQHLALLLLDLSPVRVVRGRWIGRRCALSLPAEKSCRFNLHTLKVAFGRGKAIPHSLYAMSLSVAQVEGDQPGWLVVVPPWVPWTGTQFPVHLRNTRAG